mmetsp:Transcript_28013/g.70964  ORF Transcript_28013/g.70964 Transcript_28013/m.70964 type:complete len:200 (-) Transcript_28013:1430-2029(-)
MFGDVRARIRMGCWCPRSELGSVLVVELFPQLLDSRAAFQVLDRFVQPQRSHVRLQNREHRLEAAHERPAQRFRARPHFVVEEPGRLGLNGHTTRLKGQNSSVFAKVFGGCANGYALQTLLPDVDLVRGLLAGFVLVLPSACPRGRRFLRFTPSASSLTRLVGFFRISNIIFIPIRTVDLVIGLLCAGSCGYCARACAR